ncbi:hypothetical protein HaLaN_21409 [Haematococcus lacustris]|uniref:Uncharacterized protein n=1 Tax=Haematococcus lacustris TaxID=44745 RepID=A0A699ZYD6_HAELA|nr:hypothetical protein HaLaN_21409 [Haematococcus lacustris]
MSSAQALAEWHSLAAHHQPNQVLMDRLAQQLGGRVERPHSLDAVEAPRVKARSLRLSGVKKLAEQVLLKYQDPVPVARAELEFRRQLCSPELAAGVQAGMSSVLGLRTLLQQHRLRLGWAWPDLQQVAREACERAHKEQAIVAAHAEAKAAGDCQAALSVLP